jgi:hypothetical protein
MAMSANSEGLDQFEEGDAAGGHADEMEAIPRLVMADLKLS